MMYLVSNFEFKAGDFPSAKISEKNASYADVFMRNHNYIYEDLYFIIKALLFFSAIYVRHIYIVEKAPSSDLFEVKEKISQDRINKILSLL